MRVAITGSTGLIGSALAESLRGTGDEVVRLVRRDAATPGELRWNPSAPDGGLGPAALDGVDAVVNLAGAPIAGGLWTQSRKRILRDSRIGSTSALVGALRASAAPPPVLISGSAIGWYGDTGDREVDETAESGTDFLAMLVRDWEAAAAPAADSGIRVVTIRSGIVLSGQGGMLPMMLLPFRLGLGARLGSGRQCISWISLADQVGAIRFLLDRKDISGPVNLTAPAPATNAEFTRALAAALHRPAMLGVPAGLLRAGLGEMSAELLGSCRAVPARLRQAGFEFRYPGISAALAAALSER